jgi:hypothetical protein
MANHGYIQVERPAFSRRRFQACDLPCRLHFKNFGLLKGITFVDGGDFKVDVLDYHGTCAYELECRGQHYDPNGLCWTDNEDSFLQQWIHVPSRKIADYWSEAYQESGEAYLTHYAIFRHDFMRIGIIRGADIVPWVNLAHFERRENSVDREHGNSGEGVFCNVPYCDFTWWSTKTGHRLAADVVTFRRSKRSKLEGLPQKIRSYPI